MKIALVIWILVALFAAVIIIDYAVTTLKKTSRRRERLAVVSSRNIK